jgi:sporulation protein YlmC with PRC-barrel domain
MIQDYKKLKTYCNIDYKINNNTFKIGNLSDTQLEIANKILQTKFKPSNEELTKLKAINYIINYRSSKAIEKLQNDIITNRINKAEQKAEVICNWLVKAYKN